MVENDFAHTHAFGRYLNIFVSLDVFKSLLERKDSSRNDVCFLIGSTSPDICELLRLANIDDDVVLMDMLTNDLTRINLILWFYKEAASIL